MERKRILIAEDEAKMRRVLELNLRGRYDLDFAGNGQEALALIQGKAIDLVLTDMRMPVKDGISLLHDVKRIKPDLPVILVTAYGSVESAVRAMKEGAYDYIVKPLKMDEIEMVIEKALAHAELVRENRYLKAELQRSRSFDTIVSVNPKILEILDLVRQIADSKATVLLEGESGTGKELVARALHYNSQRASGPFVVVNCSAIPRELLESELFGYEKGAFTGATRMKIGSFEMANNGTLFLDEIGEMPKELQAKILRALEGHRFMRVGGVENIEVDTRVVTATNRSLKEAVRTGAFREDLYYRLNVLRLKLPPLRERREDIPLLVRHFLEKHREESRGRSFEVSDRALALLGRYDWPGNVRELENCIVRAMVLAKSDVIGEEDLPPEIRGGETAIPVESLRTWDEVKAVKKAARERVAGEIERAFIEEGLRRNRGNVSRSSIEMGLDRRQLQNMIRKYRIKPHDYR
ncbi:MAG: sigma-54-dependent Fis family transcriptional regulator [Deltaproteobacteria bacterium]|nr:sigma-54-dependent Fis family transcriptional regulator [Deltaproteobacteria bacterium]